MIRASSPLRNSELTTVGVVGVGPNGELIVEPYGGGHGQLDPKAAAELAVEILKRARPEYRLIESEGLISVMGALAQLFEESSR